MKTGELTDGAGERVVVSVCLSVMFVSLMDDAETNIQMTSAAFSVY